MNKFKIGDLISRGSQPPLTAVCCKPDAGGYILAHSERKNYYYLVLEHQYEKMSPSGVDESTHTQCEQAIENADLIDRLDARSGRHASSLTKLEKRIDNLTAAVDRLQRWRGNVQDAND